jgi:hypothetical protein
MRRAQCRLISEIVRDLTPWRIKMRERRTLLDAWTAAKYVGLARQTLAAMRVRGGGPAYFKLGARIMYDRDDLDLWIDARRRISTSEIGGSASTDSRNG